MGQKPQAEVTFVVRAGLAAGACLMLANCVTADKYASKIDPKYGVSASPRVVAMGEPVPKGGGVYRVGKPYVVAGKTYYPEENKDYSAVGTASWYGADFHGRRTANGEIFDMTSITAAHPTMPIPSYARVTNLRNGKSIIVRVNDRGPYHGNRVIDVSVRTAKLLEFHSKGLARVRVDYVGRAPLDGSDDRVLVASLSEGSPAEMPGSRVRVASNRPFLPAGRLGRDVPVPDSRPYDLGEDERMATPAPDLTPDARQDLASGEDFADRPRNAHAQITANLLAPTTLDRQAASFDQRFSPQLMANDVSHGDPAAAPNPVAAYSDASADRGRSRDLLSGRGLY